MMEIRMSIIQLRATTIEGVEQLAKTLPANRRKDISCDHRDPLEFVYLYTCTHTHVHIFVKGRRM